MPHQEFTLKIYDFKTLFYWRKKNLNRFCVFWLNVALFFISVFMRLYSCWHTLIESIMFATSCSLSFIFFNFLFFLYFFAPLFAKLDFAVFPDAFPCIIYDKKENQKEKKTFGLFFTVVSLLYNNTVRIFLEF